MRTHIFDIELAGGPQARKRRVRRELAVREDASLYDLPAIIVRACDFDFDHAFGFFSRLGEGFLRSERKYELFADMDIAEEHPNSLNVERTRVCDVWKILGDTMTFLFDYGDMWRFTVGLVGFGIAEPNTEYPRVLRSEGRSPKQYPA